MSIKLKHQGGIVPEVAAAYAGGIGSANAHAAPQLEESARQQDIAAQQRAEALRQQRLSIAGSAAISGANNAAAAARLTQQIDFEKWKALQEQASAYIRSRQQQQQQQPATKKGTSWSINAPDAMDLLQEQGRQKAAMQQAALDAQDQARREQLDAQQEAQQAQQAANDPLNRYINNKAVYDQRMKDLDAALSNGQITQDQHDRLGLDALSTQLGISDRRRYYSDSQNRELDKLNAALDTARKSGIYTPQELTQLTRKAIEHMAKIPGSIGGQPSDYPQGQSIGQTWNDEQGRLYTRDSKGDIKLLDKGAAASEEKQTAAFQKRFDTAWQAMQTAHTMDPKNTPVPSTDTVLEYLRNQDDAMKQYRNQQQGGVSTLPDVLEQMGMPVTADPMALPEDTPAPSPPAQPQEPATPAQPVEAAPAPEQPAAPSATIPAPAQPAPQQNYQTPLNEEQASRYAAWRSALPKELQEDSDYDLQGMFLDNPEFSAKSGQHLIDKFKKPNHITFSDESKYSAPGQEGGHWSKDSNGKWSFTPSPYNLSVHTLDEIKSYFKKYEPDSNLILQSSIPGNKWLRKGGSKRRVY